jgi:arabinose-5-phosphate isomerase
VSASSDLTLARSVIRIERDALDKLEASLGNSLVEAVELILSTDRHVVVAGVGKSGHIGQKIAASLASTGTPAFFIHPTEASHGDLGMLMPGSVVIAISYSGESRELVDLLRYCKGNDIPVIAMTRAADSTLGRFADVLLEMPTVTGSLPERPRADLLNDDGPRPRRRPHHRADGAARILARGFRLPPPGRQARPLAADGRRLCP